MIPGAIHPYIFIQKAHSSIYISIYWYFIHSILRYFDFTQNIILDIFTCLIFSKSVESVVIVLLVCVVI